MKLKSENDIISLIENDKWMMDILSATKSLKLPDWWVCAGFVRSKIWDTVHERSVRTSLEDIDVIYYDSSNLDEKVEKEYEEILKNIIPTIPWSVKNEARMNLINNLPPYQSSVDAMSKFPETATALGVKINDLDELILAAPCGIEDVLNCVIRPTSTFLLNEELMRVFEERIEKKNWKQIWNKVKIVPESYRK